MEATQTLSLFDAPPEPRRVNTPYGSVTPSTGQQRKAEGMAAVVANEEASYKAHCWRLAEHFARTHREFTGEMLNDFITKEIGPPKNSKNFWGSVVVGMARKGWIEKSGKFAVSERATSNAHDGNPVWRARIYGGAA